VIGPDAVSTRRWSAHAGVNGRAGRSPGAAWPRLLGALAAGALLAGLGCGSDPPSGSPTPDVGDPDLAGPREDAEDATADPDTGPAPSPWLPAHSYCEAVVDVFCPYYQRCARMAVDSLEACRAVFAEVCEERYEPIYRALEELGMVRLSAAGILACERHLADVACEAQMNDLDGACAGMWVGEVPIAGACGLGIESLVCAPDATCVIGLDFCGTCEPAADLGEPCGEGIRCHREAACVDGRCVQRGAPGQACAPDRPCAIGASCAEGSCVGPTIVALHEPCDQARRCPYHAACVSGHCARTPLLGEPCGAGPPCASGSCQGGLCVPSPPGLSACVAP